jgi:hypothetical protein
MEEKESPPSFLEVLHLWWGLHAALMVHRLRGGL